MDCIGCCKRALSIVLDFNALQNALCSAKPGVDDEVFWISVQLFKLAELGPSALVGREVFLLAGR